MSIHANVNKYHVLKTVHCISCATKDDSRTMVFKCLEVDTGGPQVGPQTNACVRACRQASRDIHKNMHTNTPTYMRTCKNVTHACIMYCNYVTAVTHAAFTANIFTVSPPHLNQKMHQSITCGMNKRNAINNKHTYVHTQIDECACYFNYVTALLAQTY